MNSLPTSVHLHILSFANLSTILSYSALTKNTNKIVHDPTQPNEKLWKQQSLLLSKYPNYEKDTMLNWRQDFIHKYLYPHDPITKVEHIPMTEPFHPTGKLKTIDIWSDKVPGSAIDIFYSIFTVSSVFEYNYHHSRGDSSVMVSPWVRASDGIGKTRLITFTSPVNNAMGPKETRVHSHQRVIFLSDDQTFVVQALTKTLDVPYGDSFFVQLSIIIVDNKDGTSTVSISAGVIFVKSTILKWKIEDLTIKEVFKLWTEWGNQMKQFVIEEKQNKRLFSDQKGPEEKKDRVEKKKKKLLKLDTKSRVEIPKSPTRKTAPIPPRLLTPRQRPTVVVHQQHHEPSTNYFQHVRSNIAVPLWLIISIVLLLVILLPQHTYVTWSMEKFNAATKEFKLENFLLEQQLLDMLRN
jgi:hypothetical protein